ncbi:MAG: DUF2273 domain-containing protein [Clostridia bacterium]|nr:DUF2273 domain-containing protein [Clostridia bacterium]
MKDKFKNFYRGHKSGVWGACIGLTAGLLFVLIGFWKTIFLLLCVAVGFLIGKIYVSDTPLGEKMRKVFGNREDDK